MNIEEFRTYCLSKTATTEGTPFGPDVLVFKVADKMFALCDIQKFESVNLKCDPEKAIILREQYPEITAGYHMSKAHWNTIVTNTLSNKLVYELIDHSYDLVMNSLPKKVKIAHGFAI